MSDVGQEVKDAAQKFGDKIQETGKAVNRQVNDAAKVINPDDRMPRYYSGVPSGSNASELSNQIKKDARRVGEKVEQVAEDVGRGVKRAGQRVGEAAHEIGSKAKELGRKVQGKVQDVIDDIKSDKFPWAHLIVAGVVIFIAAKIIRAETTK